MIRRGLTLAELLLALSLLAVCAGLAANWWHRSVRQQQAVLTATREELALRSALDLLADDLTVGTLTTISEHPDGGQTLHILSLHTPPGDVAGWHAVEWRHDADGWLLRDSDGMERPVHDDLASLAVEQDDDSAIITARTTHGVTITRHVTCGGSPESTDDGPATEAAP